MKITFANARGIMNQHRMIYVTIAIIYLLLASCTNNQAEEMKPETPPVPETPNTAVTYTNFVQGLMQTRCAGCHGPAGSAAGAFTFNGYTSVTANSARVRQAVLVSKTMPKGGSLSQTELESLTKWFDNGMPQ